jgi:hypothetical protein
MVSFESVMKQLENSDVLEQLGKSVGAKPAQVKKVAQLGLPTLMEAMNRNTNDKKGAQSLSSALDSHKGVDLSNVLGFLNNVDTDDGSKIVGHVLGDKSTQVTKSIAKKTGLSISQIGSLLVKFGPLLLSFLGNKKKEENLDADGVSGLTGTLAGLFGGSGNSSGGGMGGSLLGMASSFLDGKDDDDDDDGGGGLLDSLSGLFN